MGKSRTPEIHEHTDFTLGGQDINPVINLATLRKDVQLQNQVEQRLRELVALSSSGNESKLKSQGDGVNVFVKTELGGPKSLFWQEVTRKGCPTIS